MTGLTNPSPVRRRVTRCSHAFARPLGRPGNTTRHPTFTPSGGPADGTGSSRRALLRPEGLRAPTASGSGSCSATASPAPRRRCVPGASTSPHLGYAVSRPAAARSRHHVAGDEPHHVTRTGTPRSSAPSRSSGPSATRSSSAGSRWAAGWSLWLAAQPPARSRRRGAGQRRGLQREHASCSPYPWPSGCCRGLTGIGNDIKKQGVSEHGYTKTPLKALHSMMQGWKLVRADLPKVTQPVLIFRSREDHVVDEQSTRNVLAGISSRDVDRAGPREQLPRRHARQRRAADLRRVRGVHRPRDRVIRRGTRARRHRERRATSRPARVTRRRCGVRSSTTTATGSTLRPDPRGVDRGARSRSRPTSQLPRRCPSLRRSLRSSPPRLATGSTPTTTPRTTSCPRSRSGCRRRSRHG